MVSTHIGFPTETVIVFIALSVGAIFIDLFMHRDDKPISLKSAALWSVFWVVVAMAFAGFLYIHHGAEVAQSVCHGLCAGESAVGRQPVRHDGHLLLVRRSGSLSPPCSLLGDHWCHCLQGIFVAIGTSLLSLGRTLKLSSLLSLPGRRS